MTARQQKTLRLVTESKHLQTDGGCKACEAMQRQLEHVKMLLNAAMLAASQIPKTPGDKL